MTNEQALLRQALEKILMSSFGTWFWNVMEWSEDIEMICSEAKPPIPLDRKTLEDARDAIQEALEYMK